MSDRFQLRFLAGPLMNQTFSLGMGERLLLGKDPECGVVIAGDALISRKHALLHYEAPGKAYFEDLGSTNGSFVNGKRVTKRHRLSPGDRVTLGRFSTFQGSWFNALEPSRFHTNMILSRVSEVAVRAREATRAHPARAVATLAAVAVASSACAVAVFTYLSRGNQTGGEMGLAAKAGTSPRSQAQPAAASASLFVWDEIVNISRRFGDAPPSVMDKEFLGEVEKHIRAFTLGDGHKQILKKREAFWPVIEAVLQKQGLPAELGYVVWVESGFDANATSHAGAKGLWQFMPETAREYGLAVGAAADERVDPAKSSEAAARYLTHLMKMFGSNRYLLALASYNAGQNRIMRRKIAESLRSARQVDFWHLKDQLPKETLNYVPKILAAMIIARNPERW